VFFRSGTIKPFRKGLPAIRSNAAKHPYAAKANASGSISATIGAILPSSPGFRHIPNIKPLG